MVAEDCTMSVLRLTDDPRRSSDPVRTVCGVSVLPCWVSLQNYQSNLSHRDDWGKQRGLIVRRREEIGEKHIRESNEGVLFLSVVFYVSWMEFEIQSATLSSGNHCTFPVWNACVSESLITAASLQQVSFPLSGKRNGEVIFFFLETKFWGDKILVLFHEKISFVEVLTLLIAQ